MAYFISRTISENVTAIHYVFESLAFFVGIRYYYFTKKRIVDPISETNRLWIMLGAMIGALIGSRLIAILENPEALNHMTFMHLYQSKTVAGGFVGGLFGVEMAKKIVKVNIASGDIYVIPIIIAVFIGRVGCFLSGVQEPTFGIETTFLTGIDLGDGLLRHPVALYEMVYMILLFVGFKQLKSKTCKNGDQFKLFMVLYFLYRFFVEFLKPYHPLFLHLSSIHWSAIFIIMYYYRFIIRIIKL